MVEHTTLSGNESNELFCPDCETNEHILEVGGTTIEQLNFSNQSRNFYECQNCGATGEVHSDYNTGSVLYKGELFGDVCQ
ncbi:hypothetical protein OB955_04835 [Halobacteria archaeon AArc-m2/3/4]|uniref:Uncharacterized protein n=1 Tax=Natronoglomus mannanivorans TaxID=2979990 RepID=A0ABT2QAV7_9EURY|nr:hypothetical protein [Halobacteria archaeon AArc-m2/3/4]